MTHSRALLAAALGVALPVGMILALGVASAGDKARYELVKDLFVPLVGPLVAVLIPVVVLYVIPFSQGRQRLSLDLCAVYFAEEMRDARLVAWQHFITEQRQLPPVRRAERLNHYLDYLSRPEVHRSVDRATDLVYQKTSRVLDFFAIVNGCVARGSADPDVVRDFLLFYYLWWRDEVLDPMRRTQRIRPGEVKALPSWWGPLSSLDALAAPAPVLRPERVA